VPKAVLPRRHIVIEYKIMIAGVVRRIDIYAVYSFSKILLQQPQRKQIIPLQNVIILSGAVRCKVFLLPVKGLFTVRLLGMLIPHKAVLGSLQLPHKLPRVLFILGACKPCLKLLQKQKHFFSFFV